MHESVNELSEPVRFINCCRIKSVNMKSVNLVFILLLVFIIGLIGHARHVLGQHTKWFEETILKSKIVRYIEPDREK